MDNNKFHRISFGCLTSITINVLKYRVSKHGFFRPLLPSFFVTQRCNLNCSYCRIIRKPVKELSTAVTFDILEKIRPGNQSLSITGGEPTVRKDIEAILKYARQLNFKPVFFNTNALELHKMESILQYVDYLIVSLDSLNNEKWDKILGGKGLSGIIIRNIINASMLQKKYGFKMIINPVITADNIPDIYDIINFCEYIHVMVSPVPEDDWAQPEANLIKNNLYKKLISDLLMMKRDGRKHIIVTELFLKQVRDFAIHDCIPTLVPRIYPDGSVFYPCTPVETVYGNILDYPSLNHLLKEAHKKQRLPECVHSSNKCFMSCFMEPTNMIEKPFTVLKEQFKSISNNNSFIKKEEMVS